MKKTKIGIIGCGDISEIYLKNTTGLFANLDVVACSDLIPERSRAKAEFYGIEALTTDELLDRKDIEIVLNLTPPMAHRDISLKALNKGKHVYSEKPLGISREEGKQLFDTAREKGLYLGCAPDTFLGGGIQTCRKLIDDGWIGKPFGATAFMIGGGPAEFHPNPDFFYKYGGGPLLDMGPYFVTAMINLFGPAGKVSAFAQNPNEEKTILGPVRYGEKIKVETPTHISGLIEFKSGVCANLLTSFESHGGYPHSGLPYLQVFGTEGTLLVPDPNTFGGPVRLRRFDGPFQEIPLTHGFTENSRGIGLSDMAASLRAGRKARVSAELAYHALDTMLSFYDSADKGVHVSVESECQRPEPLPRVLPKNSTETGE